uniref:Spectrin repeat containing, nuclear envelope 1a n=1 Tax=Astyanax mexicanus TaxID=7994 RepID=A0A8B9RI12_ASTMX
MLCNLSDSISIKDISSNQLILIFCLDEQEAVQKRTFTKWINSHLAKRDPPLVVKDLYEDIKDGVMLLALLEVLSGHKLPCEQGRKLRRIHWLANVGTALRFLEGRRSVYRGSPIKLVNINTTDIVDGRPSIVLGLIWTIILYFQIEELTSSLPPQKGQNSSNSSVDSSNSTETASPPVKRKPRLSFQGGAKRALLKWVQRTATKRLGLDVKDFGPSWRSGVAFHAVIFALRPQLVNMERVWNRPNRANLEEAFSLAERELGIPRLLDPEDVDVDKPDEKSIMTYVAQFLKHHPDAGEAESVGQQEEVLYYIDFKSKLCLSLPLSQSFKQYRVQYELKRRQVLSSLQSTQRDGILTSDQALFKQAWERISTRLLDWHIQLDSALPNPLGAVGIWLHQAEKILQEEPLPQQSHEQTANAIHQTLQQHQVQCCIQNKERSLHRDRSVSGVPVPAEQLQDMAERLNYISTSSHVHLSKLEFWELKYRMLALLTLGESKLKSWIVKYGRLETTQLLLQSYVSFVEGQQFFQKYESLYEDLKQAAVLYTNADSSAEEAVRRFLRDMADQWRSLAVEIRSVRSMLKEVEGNWEKYSSAVSSLQAWLEDAQVALHQPENTKREFFRNLPHWMDQHTTMNDSGNFLIETCDETVSRDLKHQLLLLNGRWRDMFIKSCQSHLAAMSCLCGCPLFKKKLEVQYKTAARSAQLRARDTVNGDRRQTLTTMASIKGQLYKVQHERLLFIVRELQVLMQEALEWRRVAETNGNLTRRFEESRAELEKALRVGQACLKERGDPAELLSKHNDFFGRLDQRVLNAYLKACDDLTDILPEEEQQGLQESVRRLHKQWKDIQAEAPAHLLRLKVEAERRIVLASLQECRIELQKEDKAIATSGSERVIREHRVYFRQKDPLAVCERRLKTMEQLCQKLPENDPMQRALLETKDHLLEVRDEVERTYVRFQQHPDKWREWHHGVLKGHVDALDWLKTRLSVLEDVSTEAEVLTQTTALEDLSIQFNFHVSSLEEVRAFFMRQFRVLSLFLKHLFKSRGRHDTWENFKHLIVAIRFACVPFLFTCVFQSTLRAWQDFEQDREAVGQFVCSATPILQRERIFSSLENLTTELDHAQLHTKTGVITEQAKSLVKKAAEIQLGAQNHSLLHDQAQAAQERVQEIHISLEKMIMGLEKMQVRWQNFNSESEAFSSWVCEREKELEALDLNSAHLDQQLQTVEERMKVLSQLESESHALARFITPGGAERIKARLIQIGRYWEELRSNVKQRGMELQASVLHKVNCSTRCLMVSRIQELQAHLAQLEQFNQALVTFTLWSENFLGELRRKSKVTISDLISVKTQIKDEALLQTQREAIDGLQQHMDALGPSLSPEDLQRLQVRKEDCLQPVCEAQSLLQRRSEALGKLETFLVTYRSATNSVQTLQGAVEGRGSWDQAKAEQLNQDLGQLAQKLASLEVQAISLDSSLNKASLHLHRAEGERTSCRRLVDEQGSGLQRLQRSLGTRQSEAETLAGLWNSFRGRKELLLRSLMELEEKVRKTWLTEPSTQNFQQRYCFSRCYILFFSLSNEIHFMVPQREIWLFQIARQIMKCVGTTSYEYENIKYVEWVIFWQEQCAVLLDVCKDYFTLKSRITSAVERAHAVTAAQSGQHNPEDIRRALSRLEAVKPELAGTQEELNLFFSKGKHLISELRKLPEHTGESVRTEMDCIVDRWLDTSERLDSDIDHLTVFLALWNEINSIANDIECWTATSVSELSEGAVNLLSSSNVDERLLELESKEEVLKVLQRKVTELQEVTKTQQTPAELQTMEADLRKKIIHAGEVYEQTRSIVKDFGVQRQQLQDIISQLAEQLETIEYTLSELSQSSDPENVAKIKVSFFHFSSFAFRPSLERSCQASLTLSDGRAGDPEASQTMELLSSHQALVQEAWVRLRGLQEYQAFNEALRAMGDWLEEVEEKLEKLESTEGDKKEVEERLERVQDILLMKGEGEVKLNMAAGKGELVIKSSGEAGQGVIHFKLQEVEDAWAALLLRAMSCHSRLEWTVSQWGLFVESRAQLQGWLEQVEAEVKGPLEPQLGLREKRQQLDRLCLLSADVEDHQGALCYLEESAAELYKRTGDATFREDETALLRAQFDDVRAATEVMVRFSECVVFEHEKYMETVRELTDWLLSKGEDLQRCSDPSGNSASIQRKLTDVRVRKELVLDPTHFRMNIGVLEGLQAAEVMEEKLKARLNELCGFSTDLGPQSERVSALIKLHNSLGLRASRECQNKEKLLEQRFRSSLRDFRQWLVNANISTAKCFDSPHSIQEASAALQRIQEFMSDREQGQARLDAVLAHGEQLSAVVQADRVEAVRAKTSAASDDWRSLMDNLQQREAILQGLQSRMQAFEESLQPLQDWLNRTEITVQDSSTRLHDLPAKRLELCKLQSVLEEMCCREPELGGLRERAHSLWEGQAAGKGFVHRVCQLAARYLALSNRTKEKVSRIERVVGEHQLFSQGLQELQSWVSEAQKILETCRSTTADKSMLVTRMGHLEDLLTARQEREIQLKMLITRGEAVQRNTSAEGVPVVRKQIQDLKDSWDLLLSGTIQCKSQLEGALSHWTSYQEDVSQFEGWLERVEESLGSSDKHYTEMRDKTANLRKAKLLYEEVLSRSSPLDTIATKGSNMTEHSATQQEVHKLNERYEAVKAKAKAAVSKAEELVLVHQEYQRGLHMFEDWLEQEQSSLALLSPLDGDVDTLEKTLKELESSCSQGLTLLKSALASREQVVPWGVPQIEERALETAQREWQEYQERMRDTKTQVVQTLSRLQQLESCFQSLDQWVEDIERKVRLRSHRRSDSTTKDTQLQQLLVSETSLLWLSDFEMEGLSALAQQIVEDAHVSARVSTRVTQLTARYHAVLLRIQVSKEHLNSLIIAEAQSTLRTFSVWQSVAAAEFRTVSESKEALDRTTMEKKMKRLETLQGDMDHGHRLLKTLREKVEQAISFLDDSSASKLEREVQAGRSHLEELILGLRAEHSTTERRILLYKEFQERYKTQQQWLSQTRALLSSSVEPKAELYQRRAQLAKYKAVEQALLSRNSAVSSVLEKGETLLSLLHSPSIKENMDRLQTDYKGLRTAARVQKLEGHVKKQEAYHTELQEVERWLLQMSSRMVTPDPAPDGGLEAATQQLARHKAIMEEIAGFEERLAGLKERGEELVSGCSERLQARLRQQTQSHLQGARDSYSAICSTAQRVYQSLDRELQRHVSLRDTLQQCQTWLSNIQEELQPPCWGLSVQVKQERTLQEQASTYLQLVCSTCDLSDEKVRETAADIQQVKIQVEERMLESQELAENWRTIESLRSDLESRLREAEQLLQNMFRRSAELEPKVAQNQLDQAQDFIQEMQARQADLAHLRESVGKLVTSQESPELLEVGRLRRAWLELGKQAAKLLEQREEDLQRSGDYHECLSTAEELFDQLSNAEKNTVEYLDALKKLSLDLQDQRCVLDDLRDNRNTILPRLSLEDKDLVKEQVGYLEQRWIHLEMQVQQKIQDTMKTLEDLNHLEDQLRETQEWAEVQRPSVSEVLKTSPPPDLAQSFLFDHLSFCAELEAKQQLLTQVVSEADSLSSHLGLDERRSLQALVQEVQTLLESLGAKAAQHRKSLSKVFTERTQFLQALDRATGWIKQQEQRVLADEHIALLPDELSKQVSTCKNICSTLRAYQVELTSLWTQGRELVMNATEEEKTETLQRLEELQGTFESSLQRCTQHLQHLEKALVIRKYFKVDLDRVCEWLREAEAAVFPVIDLSGSDERLQNQLDKYQQLLDQTSAYENLLLIVQRAGQEILPTLNEVDHCYLDEKLNGLPQQYNNILVSTKEKRERVQRVIVERREFESLIEVTHKALRQLQEQCDALEEPQTSQSLEGGQRLHSDYSELEKGLANLFQAMKELRGKTQDFQSMGQPYKPEVVEQLVSLHSRLNRVTKDKVKQLNSTLNTLKDYNAAVLKMDSSMNAIKEKLCSDEHTDAMQRLSSLHKLAKDLEDVASFSETLTGQRKELGQHFESNALKTQVASEKPQLQALKSKISDCINECENSVVESCSFQTEIKVTLKWLKTLREKIRCPFNLQKTNVDLVEDEVRSVLALEDEMKSRLKLLNILRENEKQKSNTELSSHIEGYLKDIEKLETEVRQALTDKQIMKCMYTCSFIVLHNVWTAIILKRLTLKLHLYLNLLFLLFFRCSAQWSVFQIESKEFIKQMSEIEKRLEGFSTAKASSLQEAEDKLQSHHVSLGFFLFIHKLTKLEEHIAQFDETVSGAMVSHSVCAMRCQWTQLNSVARAQEKALKDTVHDWRCFTEKVTSKNVLFCHCMSKDLGKDLLIFSHLLQQVSVSRQQVQLELLEREEVERELGLVKGWIQDTQGLLLSPTADLDTLLSDLEVQNFTTPLRETQCTCYRLLTLCEELVHCSHALSELDVAVQEFGEQNPLLARQLSVSLSKLTELHSQTSRLAEGKTTRLKKAEQHFEEFNEMLTLVLNWTEKAETLISTNIVWSPASMMQEQIRTHQALLREWRKLQGDMEGLVERVGLLGDVVQTEALHQQVAELSHHAEELQQRAKSRLLSLQDAAKDLGRLESEVKSLHQSVERVQETLASPDLAHLSLREQLVQRQLLLTEMEGIKVQVQALQTCMSNLQLPEEAMATLPLCVTAQNLQQDSSHLQHTAIQQCNILQEAMVQYEQYEQEVKNLQKLIEEAHRVIQDRPVATGNIQELQTQIQHHEELAQKIKGYQEQIAALNSKCKMLTVKAKHATMLLTVSEVDGLSDDLEELEEEEVEMSKHPATHPSVVMMTAGRCHTLLSPVTEESGEEGTNSEVSSPPACRSPSPGPNADASLNQVPPALLLASLIHPSYAKELYDPSMESSASANLDDLQRSWETLKNVISEKQKSLYEALERQQHYQEALQSVSTKMESIETSLNEGLEPGKSPESQMAAHQALMDEILMLQDEISALQACFSEELQRDEESPEQDVGDQLALHSTLTVLGERMATIRMKASGKRQLLEERLSEQLEEQRQEQALQRYHSEAEELDHWLLSTRASLTSALQPNAEDMDMEEQLIDCQNMLMEIEQKVLCLSELSVHSESLLLEGKVGMRGDAEQLTLKLHGLKSSLLELQRILQDKHTHIQFIQHKCINKIILSFTNIPDLLQCWIITTTYALFFSSHFLQGLNKEVKNVSEEVSKCREAMGGDAESMWGGEGDGGGHDLIEEVLDGLEERLRLVDSLLDQRCDSIRDRVQEHVTFQVVSNVLVCLWMVHCFKSLRFSALNIVCTFCVCYTQTLAEAEDGLREFEQRVCEMRGRGETLQQDPVSTQELLKLQDVYEELVEMVGSRRSSLNQTLVLKAQYEKALQDLQELVDTAHDKMAADQKMTVGSVLEVQILLDKHKEFFQGLEAHVVLTQAFFRQVSGVVVQREAQALEQTVAQAQTVLKQAHRRGVELEGILEAWSRFVGDYQAVYRQLEAVESSIPSVGLVEETEERLTERIALYQRLKSSLAERQQQLYEVLEDGKKLLLSVCCSELEAQLTQLGEHWLCCTTKVNKELHRLDSTLKHWTSYQSDSAELGQWLASALDRLEFWSTQSVTVPQELETVRDHLHAFLEFSKEVDAKSSLRSSVLSRGNQLLRLKRVDTAALRSHLGQVETQWADLLTRIPVVQEKLHQLQMEKLASRHAITELMSWISLMENIIQEDQSKIMEAVGSEVVQTYIQKYKGFRIDLSCKQLTVDFVNQSVLQMSSQDVEGKRSDKTDFAERLGAMNRRWQILQGLITEKIQLLEGLLESWLEYENGVQALKTWISMQEEKTKRKPRIEDVASAQNALKDCQELEELLKEKEKELEKVEEKGRVLVQDKKGEASSVVMETLKGLNQSWTNLDQMIGQTKVSLRAVLEQWSLYKRACEEIHGYLMEGRYSISRLHLLTGSPEAVLVQVENLENLQEELDRQESSLKKFGSLTEQLLKDSHPSVADSLNTALSDVNHRWNTLLEQISEQLRNSKSLLQLWQHYKQLHEHNSKDVQRLEERAERLLNSAAHREITEEEVKTWIRDCSDLLKTHGSVQGTLQQLTEVEEQLRLQVEPSAMATFHTDYLSLNQRLATVGHGLHRQQSLLEAGMKDYESFTDELDSLSRCPEEAEEVLKVSDPAVSAELFCLQERMDKLKTQMLKLSRLSPDLEHLNGLGYRLPLNDQEMIRLQNLNRTWASCSAHTTERFSKLQAAVLQRQSFLEKCEAWLTFLTQTEEKLAAEISGNYQSLLEQQREHELFQAEMFSRQQILYSIISDGHQLLNQGQVEDRDDFGLKLALLSNQWQGVVRRAQQRRGIIDGLVCQWQRYTELAEKLRHWLKEVQEPEEQQEGGTVTLQQARGILDHIQLKERVLQRQQGSYVLAVEAGRQLLLSADARAEALLQSELTDLQERWRSTSIRLDERKKELLSLLKDWEQCEKGIAASHEKLRAFKRKLSLALPDHHEELHSEQIRCKELEGSTEGWTDDVTGLCVLRDALSSNLSSDDLTVLQERLELLQRQWEETCHQLALRRQQVSEKLNEWAVFNEKNKELCEWLTHMESKVSQNGDITIEEMIEKLRKDYQEEISVAEENKQQLEQMGERLARSSHESKAAEIHYKLSKVNERWQHLLDLIAARVKKLRETLVAVQQLDKNMSSLRSWLAHIETELSRPIVYETCDTNEIQKKLNQQQDMQRDIEKHSTGVASVLNLCEVLLHDCDACATETECDSIQQATRGLDRRWRNICAVAMERRLKIEETWRLWQKFLDDYSRFEDWLKASERTAALPNSSGVLYTVAKEELKKFEAFQRQVQECLTQLELINKQYRRLARENRTDSSCRLRQMVHDGNRRWDTLQRRVTAILRRLKHFISQREEFETARDSILVWLTEMDLQLTNIEHFSECDVQAKIKQLKAFQQEIELNTMKIGSVFSQGEALMEKSEPLDAAVIEEELDELQRYCREVFGRVERYYRKLTRLPLVDDDCDGSDREFDLDGSGDLSDLQWEESNSLPRSNNSRPPSVNAAPLRANGSGRDTPASVDSIPLEWDHDYDLEPMSHSISSDKRGRDGEEDEDILCDVVIPESPEAYIKLTENTLRSSSGTQLVISNWSSGVIARWELMQAQSHSSQNSQREDLVLLQQITSDLEAMEAWFNKTENELTELRGKDLSTDIRTIKERIRKLKELQKEVDAHKSKILSLNLSSVGLLQSDSEESRKLRERLKEMNSRWDRLGKALQQWRGALQEALMQCQEFHELSHGLLLWLENIDRRRNEIVPISSGLDRHTLRAHYRALEQIQQELVDSEQRVSVLQDLSVHLLVQAQGSECLEAQERVHVIGNRLRLLLKAVASDLQLLERELRSLGDTQDLSAWSLADDVETSGSASPVSVVNVPVQQSRGGSACASSRSGTSGPRGGAAAGRCQSFLLRVLRAALPLQLLLLLIVGLACLVPMTEEDYSCAHANNFARSFHPMLRYTNGPPPI